MKKHQSRSIKPGNIWQIQEAKAKFSQVLQKANEKGYQTITKNGEPIAVIISKTEFDKILKPNISLLEFFESAPYPEIELDTKRSKDLPRDTDL